MGDAVTGIDAIGEAKVDLDDMVDQTTQNADVHRATSDALTEAIEEASKLPLHNASPEHDISALSGPGQGEYGSDVKAISSHVTREGAEQETEDLQDGILTIAETMTELTRELTEWQITWGVAQAAQKDLTHILKSQ